MLKLKIGYAETLPRPSGFRHVAPSFCLCVCIYYSPQIIQLCLAMQRLMLDSNLSQSTGEVTVDRDIITKINTTEERTCLTGGNKVMLKNTIIQVYISVDLRESIKEIVSPRKFVNYVLELLSCGLVISL